MGTLSEEQIQKLKCGVCRQKSLKRIARPFSYEISHEGRPPVTVRIPDLEVIACTNPDCRPEQPGDNVIEDDATLWRIGEETYRQLGLLTPREIREGREKLGLSQQELQELLGLGGNSLSRWENGRVYQSRSIDRFLRVVFGVPETLEYLRACAGLALQRR
jgi:putative zinc finger/helix-turn-helix YgiT family protein